MSTPSQHHVEFTATGHLLNSGLLSEALDAVDAAGATYRVQRLDIGKDRDLESTVEVVVFAPDEPTMVAVTADLLSLGFSELGGSTVQIAEVDADGVAPTDFYSTTNLRTQIRYQGKWQAVQNQRMDAVIVVDEGAPYCLKLRDLRRGQRVVTGMHGIQLAPAVRGKRDRFSFMSGSVSSERRLAAQVERVAEGWRSTRAAGRKVIVVAGPVVVHVGAAEVFSKIVRAGLIDGLLSGNALAVHDVEAALLGTSLGVDVGTGRPVVHGHMHHMRAINAVRRSGSLAEAVADGTLETGVMHSVIEAGVPFCLAGSIRDDGPLPDTEMDLIEAQARYAEILEGAGMVLILGSMLHGIGVGNMIQAEVMTVCVDIHPAVVAKLNDRGSAQTQGIVTDAGAFLEKLAGVLLPPTQT